MSKAYFLSEDFLGGASIVIDEEKFRSLSDALTMVVSAVEIEELFQVFSQSYVRFEKELLDVVFEYTYLNKRFLSFDDFFNSVRYRFNVSVITVLTSYRSYDDHCQRILKALSIPEGVEEFNREARSQSYDRHLSYRICAELRNYAQHQALPLGGFSIGGKTNLGRNIEGRAIKLDSGINVSPWLDVIKFKASPKCKGSLRQELEGLGFEKIDMKWLIRSFAGAMHERHSLLRDFLKPAIEFAGQRISDAYDFASSVKESKAEFLELCSEGESRPMRRDLASITLKAFATDRSLQGVARSYVTSQIIQERNTYSGQPY